MTRYYKIAAILCCAFLAGEAHGEALATEKTTTASVRIVGRSESTVTTPSVRLGDLAIVSSSSFDQDEGVIALQKIVVSQSPSAGQELQISASAVVEKLKFAGVDLTKVRYAFPEQMTIRRAGRVISREEVRAAVTESVSHLARDISLKSVQYSENIVVPPGIIELTATPYSTSNASQMGFTINVQNSDGQQAQFKVTGLIEEYREIPVAARGISKGTVIGTDDVVMARMNLSSLARDSALDLTRVVGLESAADIPSGDTFRSTKLVVPPVVEAGDRVSLIYSSGLLTATASGVALDSGAIGHTVRIRNETSKRIVTGTVTQPGVVGVRK